MKNWLRKIKGLLGPQLSRPIDGVTADTTENSLAENGVFYKNFGGKHWDEAKNKTKILILEDMLKIESTRVAELEKALFECANHAKRETNGKSEYAGDTYGYILNVASRVLEKE